MTLPCEIIRDLLPLYQDRVCSAESTTAVEAHLHDCPACTSALEKIQVELHATLAIPQEEVNAKEAMGALGKRWRRSRIWTALVWALAAVGLTVMCTGAYNALFLADNTPAAASKVEMAYLYRTPEGALTIRLRFKDGKRSQGTAVRQVYLEDEQGIRTCYLTLLRPRIILQTTPNALVGEVGLGRFADDDPETCERLYYGTPDEHFLIWESGMQVSVMTETEAAARFGMDAEE